MVLTYELTYSPQSGQLHKYLEKGTAKVGKEGLFQGNYQGVRREGSEQSNFLG